MTNEIWKEISGFEGVYEVSNLGRVKSLPWKRCRKEKIKKSFLDNNGYPVTRLYRGGKTFARRTHRIVAETFILNSENKPFVNHIDGDKENNKIENLEWVTHKENIKHAYDIGLHHGNNTYGNSQGENHSRAKLNEKDVRFIRENSKKNGGILTNAELAKMFGVHRSNIGMIVDRKTWTSVL